MLCRVRMLQKGPGGEEIKRKRRRKIANIEFYYFFFDVLHREYRDLELIRGILFAIAISYHMRDRGNYYVF